VHNCKLVDSLNEDILYMLVECHNRVLVDIGMDNLYGKINASGD
jgi:hypothetical protein